MNNFKKIAKKKKTAKKPKTEAFLRNDVRDRIRYQFAWYSPVYKECLKKQKISYGLYLCEICETVCKKLEVDHIPPVIRLDEQTKDVSLETYFMRVHCLDGITKVRALCCNCHSVITEAQNKIRLENRKS